MIGNPYSYEVACSIPFLFQSVVFAFAITNTRPAQIPIPFLRRRGEEDLVAHFHFTSVSISNLSTARSPPLNNTKATSSSTSKEKCIRARQGADHAYNANQSCSLQIAIPEESGCECVGHHRCSQDVGGGPDTKFIKPVQCESCPTCKHTYSILLVLEEALTRILRP